MPLILNLKGFVISYRTIYTHTCEWQQTIDYDNSGRKIVEDIIKEGTSVTAESELQKNNINKEGVDNRKHKVLIPKTTNIKIDSNAYFLQ